MLYKVVKNTLTTKIAIFFNKLLYKNNFNKFCQEYSLYDDTKVALFRNTLSTYLLSFYFMLSIEPNRS